MSTALPPRWNWLVRGFRGFVKRHVRNHFHAVRLSKSSSPLPSDESPLLIVLNHPGWWDPMIGVVLTDLFANFIHYAAIDAVMLNKYKSFNRLGFFGIDQSSFHGAAQFLRTGEAILSAARRALWVTAQGQFADVRTRPLRLRSGVGHLASRVKIGWVVPIALEYTFWTESKPEALVRIGACLPMGERRPPRHWLSDIELSLTHSLDVLNQETQSRDETRFTDLLSGKVGVGGVYDAFRRSVAFVSGQPFDAGHQTSPVEEPA